MLCLDLLHVFGRNEKTRLPAAVWRAAAAGLWTRLVPWTQQDLIEGWQTDHWPADNDPVIDPVK